MNTTLCNIQLSKDQSIPLARAIYDCLITSPIRKQDITTIKELRHYLIENKAMKGIIL